MRNLAQCELIIVAAGVGSADLKHKPVELKVGLKEEAASAAVNAAMNFLVTTVCATAYTAACYVVTTTCHAIDVIWNRPRTEEQINDPNYIRHSHFGH